MQQILDNIIQAWSNKVPSGIIDLTNEEHKYHLISVLNETINDDIIVEEIIKNIYDNK